jgi:O-antigen/teichoic acid export membrane protein
MSEQSNKKGAMAKDTIVYMLAKGIEGVVGIVTMSVMTKLFATYLMGRYSTVNIAITTVGMVCIQWLVQSCLRYINKYDILGEQESFFATVVGAWVRVNLIAVVIFAAVIAIAYGLSTRIAAVAGFMGRYPVSLLALGGMWFVTYNTAQLVIAMLAALRKAKLNLLLSLITVCGKLGIMWLLCVLFGSRLEWIFLSYFLTDGLVSVIGVITLRIPRYINRKKESKEILNELKSYGMPLMGNMLTTSVLNKSDIYIVTLLISEAAAGIYQTNYSLIATAFTLLSASVMRGSYPTILRTWGEGNKELAEKLVGEAVRFYLLLALPAVAGVAAVSDVAASVLFAPEYFEGNTIMFWVAFGMMFLGLTEYSIKYWELNANTGAIFKRSLIGGCVNVALNLILIRIFKNYYIAAVTTFIGFFVYFLLARFGTKKYMSWHLKGICYVRIIAAALIMFAGIVAIKQILPYTIINLGLFVILGMLIYGFVLYLTGEIKPEVSAIVAKLRKK